MSDIVAARMVAVAKCPLVGIAQLVARRSHNPKVVSSILTTHTLTGAWAIKLTSHISFPTSAFMCPRRTGCSASGTRASWAKRVLSRSEFAGASTQSSPSADRARCHHSKSLVIGFALFCYE